jgi:hypothetical protein
LILATEVKSSPPTNWQNQSIMVRPLVDASHAAQGELHFNTDPIVNKIPNPIIKLLIKQVHKIVADSGYVNVRITIK